MRKATLACAAALALALAGCESPVTLEQEVTHADGTGQPLDAIAFAAPAFAGGDTCYRVHDRQTGESWWLVEMPTRGKTGSVGQWVVLPREGKEDPQ